MTQFNNLGFVVIGSGGRVLVDSHVSAYSRRRAVTHVRLEPVPDVLGLFVRIATRELSDVSERQRAEVHEAAQAWYAAEYGVSDNTPPDADAPGEGVTNGTPEGAITIDDVTLDELRDRASSLALPGRSTMNKEALFAALYGADGVTNVTPSGDEEA